MVEDKSNIDLIKYNAKLIGGALGAENEFF